MMNCPPTSDFFAQKDSGRLIDLDSLIHVNKYLYIWHLVWFHVTTSYSSHIPSFDIYFVIVSCANYYGNL